MEIEELKRQARELLAAAVVDLERKGELHLALVEFMRNGEMHAHVLPGAGANDPDLKRALGAKIRADVAAGECVATILISDIYYTQLSKEANAIKTAFRMSVEQACAAGLGEQREAVMVNLESAVGYFCILRRPYRSEGNRIVLDGDTLVSESSEFDIEEGALGGFFRPPNAAKGESDGSDGGTRTRRAAS